ncbi:hypothetical protein OQJ15_14700 [Fluoribacter dumoffii]|uniref:LysM domain-containing protein n=1 Tax=Fluoribacter dumoffii TaxID=463 RepID=A0A377GDU0_9GAMM|nr:hypothetical protein [Fluoribacter dumoffii]KTC91277.1 hypothetical protein Ldum_2345 [Fluoribacter dumoffii NY 23]MCW8387554.1 hypothetical protein [Fluoribacter dumoffii]MCW8497757.1 hypothetical protein [Fluoribacter dumoffii]STO22976.1 Uncharacterised protein [Fluoribacter dumoffii]
MKKIFFFLYLSLMTSLVFANSIVLDNKTNYPKEKLGKIAVQWSVSAKAIQEANKNILNGTTLHSSSLTMLRQNDKIYLKSPKNARYFRIIVWLNDKQQPDLLTNWVDIIPDKTYVVNQNQLVPRALMVGAGC